MLMLLRVSGLPGRSEPMLRKLSELLSVRSPRNFRTEPGRCLLRVGESGCDIGLPGPEEVEGRVARGSRPFVPEGVGG